MKDKSTKPFPDVRGPLKRCPKCKIGVIIYNKCTEPRCGFKEEKK
jgi:hypothetical protein